MYRNFQYKFSIPFLLLIALVTAWMTFHGLVKVRYHGDEGSYLNDSLWFNQWLHMDFYSLGKIDEQKQLDAPVSPLLAGFSLYLARLDVHNKYIWTFDLPGNEAIPKSIYPSASVLLAARFPMALLTFGTIMLLAALFLNQVGYIPSAIVVGFILLNPMVMNALRQIMTEPSLLFFSIISLIFCARGTLLLLKHRYQKRAILFLLFAGISTGFCTSSKHNGVMALAACLSTVTLSILITRRKGGSPGNHKMIGSFILGISTIMLATACTFIILNPFIWGNPLKSLNAIITSREKISISHQQTWPKDALTDINSRVSAGIWNIFTEFSTLGCDPRLEGLVIMDTQDGSLHWEKPSSQAILSKSILCKNDLLWEYPISPITIINLLLFLIGATVLVIRQFEIPKRKFCILPTTALLIWIIALNLPIVILSPMNWSRYYLLPIIFASILIAIGISSVAKVFFRGITRCVFRPANMLPYR